MNDEKSWTLISDSVTTKLLLHESVRSIALGSIKIDNHRHIDQKTRAS